LERFREGQRFHCAFLFTQTAEGLWNFDTQFIPLTSGIIVAWTLSNRPLINCFPAKFVTRLYFRDTGVTTISRNRNFDTNLHLQSHFREPSTID
jgi:hypothetical protein